MNIRILTLTGIVFLVILATACKNGEKAGNPSQDSALEKAENAFDDSSRYEGADDLPHWHHGEAN